MIPFIIKMVPELEERIILSIAGDRIRRFLWITTDMGELRIDTKENAYNWIKKHKPNPEPPRSVYLYSGHGHCSGSLPHQWVCKW
jgi:hypothetical protein